MEIPTKEVTLAAIRSFGSAVGTNDSFLIQTAANRVNAIIDAIYAPVNASEPTPAQEAE